MNTLPLFFNLQQKTVLIVGGGDVAKRKAEIMHKSGANLIVIAKRFDLALQDFLLANNHLMVNKSYHRDELLGLKNISLIVCATDDELLNRQVYQDAKDLNIPINVVDNPTLCDFIFPAIVDRSPIIIGVSSNGKAPVLARLIRAKIESVLPSNIGAIAKQAGEFRETVKNALPTVKQRRYFWEKVFAKALGDTPLPNLENALQDFVQQDKPSIGEVYIVGAGAGNPDLLTFKALRLMQQADVVLYDALVSDEIVDLCRRDSDKIFVGKKRSQHTKSQDEINALLVQYAKAGKRVLRLKGGDPFVFGRGGEEMLACQTADVPCQVVSGITSALAAASGAGIPLTHRGVASSVRFLTACYQTSVFDGLKSTYHKDETLVFYMGLHTLERLAQSLQNSGLASDTPIAIVSNASLANQQVLTGTLKNIAARQAINNLPAPAIIIVGDVVRLYAKPKTQHIDSTGA
ncbi:MAG: siroheme synthase CysG [Moraxella sp.]|nr:siroheme synthase CysG [Moraxella sp.]